MSAAQKPHDLTKTEDTGTPGWADGPSQPTNANEDAPPDAPETAPVPTLEQLAGLSAANLAPLATLAGSASARILVAALLKRVNAQGTSVRAIQGPARSRSLVRLRHALIWYARTRLDCSYPELGRIFRKDHSTAQYAVRRFSAELEQQKSWAIALAEALCGPDLESYSQ